MADIKHYGLEQARAGLPAIVSEAKAGYSTLITRHGKPCAAVVPVDDLKALKQHKTVGKGFLALQGSGRGLWGSDSRKALKALRGEWE